MGEHDDEYRARAAECLRKAFDSKSGADRRCWQMLAASYILLGSFRQDLEQELDSAKGELATLQRKLATTH